MGPAAYRLWHGPQIANRDPTHHVPDALSGLLPFASQGDDIDNPILDDIPSKGKAAGPKHPKFNGVFFNDLGIDELAPEKKGDMARFSVLESITSPKCSREEHSLNYQTSSHPPKTNLESLRSRRNFFGLVCATINGRRRLNMGNNNGFPEAEVGK